MIEYLRDHNIKNYHYNKNNKYIVKLHNDYQEKILGLDSKPVTPLHQMKKLEDIIIEQKEKVEWQVWNDIADIFQVEEKILLTQTTVASNPVTPQSSPRYSPRELPPETKGFSPKSLSPIENRNVFQKHRQLRYDNLVLEKTKHSADAAIHDKDNKNLKGKEKMKGIETTSSITKPPRFKIPKLIIPIIEESEFEGTDSKGKDSKGNDQTKKATLKGKATHQPRRGKLSIMFNKDLAEAEEIESLNPETKLEEVKVKDKKQKELMDVEKEEIEAKKDQIFEEVDNKHEEIELEMEKSTSSSALSHKEELKKAKEMMNKDITKLVSAEIKNPSPMIKPVKHEPITAL
uniref:Uncharacterized protein n=1 Tax=Meloidogyne enterolobii TaxID=390850 RepID=A0A6V7UGM2_MELEN|nr:unnamed protein product [Meloidogyne enterolobii]